MIKISDCVFKIDIAEIWRDPNDPEGCWRFSVSGIPEDIEGESWEPRIYWEDMHLVHVLGPADSRVETVSLDAGTLSSLEAPPTLFVFEHLPLSSGSIELKKLDENHVSLCIEATCDVFFGKYQSGLPITVNANLKIVNCQDRDSP